MVVCPLCLNNETFFFVKGPDTREFKGCSNCNLIFTETRFLPSVQEERKRYLEHNNGLQYPGYVDFLNQAIEPALSHINQEQQGLDYGCGPVPTLSVILKNKGMACDDYDPIFFPELSEKVYDYIFATECFEHFFFPAKELDNLNKLLTRGGLLVVMTDHWTTAEDFRKWHYVKDFTHVCFYHRQTFNFISEKYGLKQLGNFNNRVVLFKRI